MIVIWSVTNNDDGSRLKVNGGLKYRYHFDRFVFHCFDDQWRVMIYQGNREITYLLPLLYIITFSLII